jgi:hypothetical protein
MTRDEDGAEFTHDEGGSRTDPDAGEPTADGSDSDAPAFDEAFDRQEPAEIDGERLRSRLEGDDPETVPADDRAVREIEKRSYCQGCEYFSEPPAVACTREGTEIVAVPTVDTFRVADCPFVLEDEALEERY